MASPMIGPNGISALRRCSGGKTIFTSARPCGIITDPNRPWNTRATIRNPALGASPQASDATVKPAIPSRNSRRRPIRSPSRPEVTRPSAKAAV